MSSLEHYAGFLGLPLVECFQDRGVGGSVPLEARPGGAELCQWLIRPHPGGVTLLVLDLERLFCSAEEALSTLEAWKTLEVVLHLLDVEGESYNTASPGGHFLLSILRSLGNMERERQGARGSGAPQAARVRGKKTLLGERVVRGFVVPDPVELRAIHRIQELSQAGKSLRMIADALDGEGIPTKRRAKAWSKEAIRLILQRIQRGEISSLRATQGKEEGQIVP